MIISLGCKLQLVTKTDPMQNGHNENTGKQIRRDTWLKSSCSKMVALLLLRYRYLSELDLLTQKFTQLVGGVLWLIRDGETYVDESIKIECSDTEETGQCRTRRMFKTETLF